MTYFIILWRKAKMKDKYFEEARINFEERMASQNPGKLTDEEKKLAEERVKEAEEYAKRMFESSAI